MHVKWDAKTITAMAALFAVLLGGAELRVTVQLMTDKLARIEERLVRVERAVEGPAPYAANE